MKRYIYIAFCAIFVALVAAVGVQTARLTRAHAERDRYKNNTAVLLSEFARYRTRTDSLHAAKVGELRLRLSEYERYRAADAELIKSLRVRFRDLERVTAAQSETIAELRGAIRDTVVQRPEQPPEAVQYIDIGDRWCRLFGMMRGGDFTGTIHVRDSLIITETVKYKRFMGFLWRTKKVKTREYDIVTRNPYTNIEGFEVVNIEK